MSPPNWVNNQKEAPSKGVRLEVRFSDKKGKMKTYVGKAKEYKGHSNPFGRALADLKQEAINWFVGESLDAAAAALQTLTFYIGDFAAELLKSRIGIYGDPTTPVHVYTGSMIESIAPKEDTQGVLRRVRSVAWVVNIGIIEGSTRHERSGLPVPSPRNTGEYVSNYADPKLQDLYEHQDIASEVNRAFEEVVYMWTQAGGVDAMAWAQIGATHLSNQILAMRAANYQKILLSAEERIATAISRAESRR